MRLASNTEIPVSASKCWDWVCALTPSLSCSYYILLVGMHVQVSEYKDVTGVYTESSVFMCVLCPYCL